MHLPTALKNLGSQIWSRGKFLVLPKKNIYFLWAAKRKSALSKKPDLMPRLKNALLSVGALLLSCRGEEVWEMIDAHVLRDRPPVQIYPRATFDERVLPLLIKQAQDLMPYVIRRAGIEDDKLPSECCV